MICYKCQKYVEKSAEKCPYCGTDFKFSEKLIQQAIEGKETAQQELYNRTYSDVYFTILAITKDNDLIMDVLQDTYLTAFQKLEQLKESNSFRAWVRSIAHNKTLNALRDRRVLYTASVVSVETENVLNVEDNRIENMPEATIDQQETSRLVKEILDVLPDEQRIVIGMFYYDQMSVSEIAEELECSENTVKSRLNYGRKKIQTKVLELEKNGTKLYSLAPLPFFIWLLRNLYEQPDKDIFDAIRQKYILGKGVAQKKDSSGEAADSKSETDLGEGKSESGADTSQGSESGDQTENSPGQSKESDLLKKASSSMKTGSSASQGLLFRLLAGAAAVAVIGTGAYFGYQHMKPDEKIEKKVLRISTKKYKKRHEESKKIEKESLDTEEKPKENPTESPLPEVTATPEPTATPTVTPSPTPEPDKTVREEIESTGYQYIGGTSYDVTYTGGVIYQENGPDAGISLSEAPTGVVGVIKRDMDGDGEEEYLLAVLKPREQDFLKNGKMDAALYFEVYKEQDGNLVLQGGTSDEDAYAVHITEFFPNVKVVCSGTIVYVVEEAMAAFSADPGNSGASYTYTGTGFSCKRAEGMDGAIESEFTDSVDNASEEDMLCQITIPQIYDGGDYSIVSSVYSGTPQAVTLEYRDNGYVEAEASSDEASASSKESAGGVEENAEESTDMEAEIANAEEELKAQGYIPAEFTSYDDVIERYKTVLEKEETYEEMLADGITNMGMLDIIRNQDRTDKLSYVGYAELDLDEDGSDELVILNSDGDVYEIYTQKDGQIKKIFQSSNYREAAWLVEGNLICHRATGGAGYHVISVYKLEDGSLKTVESLTVDTKVNREDTGKLNEMEQKYSDMEMNVLFNPLSES